MPTLIGSCGQCWRSQAQQPVQCASVIDLFMIVSPMVISILLQGCTLVCGIPSKRRKSPTSPAGQKIRTSASTDAENDLVPVAAERQQVLLGDQHARCRSGGPSRIRRPTSTTAVSIITRK